MVEKNTRTRERKIFCIGLGKTGTTSFGEFMRNAGFKHYSAGDTSIELSLLRMGELDELLPVVEKYESFDDYPWPFMYRFLSENYPDSFFILTRRKDSETWFKSLCKHYDRRGATEGHKLSYNCYSPRDNKDELLALYESHLNDVRQYFSGNPNFAEFCWEEGDGAREIADFLKIPKKNAQFPEVNKAEDRSDGHILKNLLNKGCYAHAVHFANNLSHDRQESAVVLKNFLKSQLRNKIAPKKNPSLIKRIYFKLKKISKKHKY